MSRLGIAVAAGALAAFGLATLGGGAARAAGEREWQLSARLGGANANGDPFAAWGFAGALDLEYGLDDAWAGRASVGAFSHPSKGGTTHAESAMAGVTYTFDVLRLVPYLEVSAGLLRSSGAGLGPRLDLAVEAGIGADYLLTPRWACGASAQYLFAPANVLGNAMDLGGVPDAFTFTLRASRIF